MRASVSLFTSVVGFAALIAACDGGPAAPEPSAEPDIVAPEAPAPEDAGSPEVNAPDGGDAGAPDVDDAGTPDPADAGTPELDAGTPVPDAGPTPEPDAGPEPPPLCAYPGGTQGFASGNTIAPHQWDEAFAPDDGVAPLRLADAPCDSVEWSPFDTLVFIAIPAW